MSGEMIENYCNDLETLVKDLIKAAEPFVDEELRLVEELVVTIPHLEKLEEIIKKAKETLKQNRAE